MCASFVIVLIQAFLQLLIKMTNAPQSYNEKSDVYSFGVILWELFMGQEPWQDKNAMQVTMLILLRQAAWLRGTACFPFGHSSSDCIRTLLLLVCLIKDGAKTDLKIVKRGVNAVLLASGEFKHRLLPAGCGGSWVGQCEAASARDAATSYSQPHPADVGRACRAAWLWRHHRQAQAPAAGGLSVSQESLYSCKGGAGGRQASSDGFLEGLALLLAPCCWILCCIPIRQQTQHSALLPPRESCRPLKALKAMEHTQCMIDHFYNSLLGMRSEQAVARDIAGHLDQDLVPN